MSERSFTASYFYSGRLKRLIRHEGCDVVLVDCSSMAPYAMDIPIPKVIDLVDVDSEKWSMVARLSSIPKRWIFSMEARRLRRFEEELVAQFEACVVVSESEKALLPEGARVVVVPNGVDIPEATHDASPDGHTLVFLGAMNYFPNVDAVVHFRNHVFPLIKKAQAKARFLIVGMDPTAQVKRLHNQDTVVTGYVPDSRPFLRQASVCVVPLRIARGIQNKVLEAMAAGVPVVATSLANAGIKAEHGKEILVADSPEDFANAVLSLLSDGALRDRISKNARSLVETRFRWERNLERLDQVLHHAARPPVRIPPSPLVCLGNTSPF
jgi:sugar transferase (PEP-CTERM/EpsH1 system associated)